MTASLHVIRDHTLLDIPAVLRVIADEIEAGAYGAVAECVVVWDAEHEVHVSYSGRGEAAPCAHLLLGVGQAKMVRAVLDVKGGT